MYITKAKAKHMTRVRKEKVSSQLGLRQEKARQPRKAVTKERAITKERPMRAARA